MTEGIVPWVGEDFIHMEACRHHGAETVRVEGGLGDSSSNPLVLSKSGIVHRGKILCLRVVQQAFRAGESERGWTQADRVSAVSRAVSTPLTLF